jgi:hypothetical protein
MGLTILIQRFREPLWKRDLAAGLILSIPGTISDSLLLNLDIMHYKGQLLPWLAPPWLVLLWIQFGMLLRTSMGFLENRPGLAAGVGLLAAPLAYSGGVRLGAASFGALEWQSLLCLGLEWAVLLPLGVKLAFPRPPASHR